jgi:hypothetical protein
MILKAIKKMKILRIVDYKKLIDTTKKALETKAEKVIVFNLADVKNKDYQFVIDNYKILGEDLEAKKIKVLINGKVMKPCNLQGEEAESGYFLFGVESGDIFLDDITINFKNEVEILNDFTKLTYGYGSLQVINFFGMVDLDMVVVDDDGLAESKILTIETKQQETF